MALSLKSLYLYTPEKVFVFKIFVALPKKLILFKLCQQLFLQFFY